MEQTAEKVDGNPETKEVAVTARGERQRGGGENSNGAGSSVVTLGADDRLEGKLFIKSDLVVHGTIDGEVVTTGDITIESAATVKARLECRNISVRGRVEGDVTAQQRLRLAGSGTLQGNVKVRKLHVEDGATFNGSISMSAEAG